MHRTGNAKRCIKHRMWRTCKNTSVYDRHFNECRLLFFKCKDAIRAINDALYNETITHAHETLQEIYTLDVIKLSNDT